MFLKLTLLTLCAARLPLPEGELGWQRAETAGPVSAGELTTYVIADGYRYAAHHAWVWQPACGFRVLNGESLVLLSPVSVITSDGYNLIARTMDEVCKEGQERIVKSADFDGDGDVDQEDFAVWQLHPESMTFEQFQSQATGPK